MKGGHRRETPSQRPTWPRWIMPSSPVPHGGVFVVDDGNQGACRLPGHAVRCPWVTVERAASHRPIAPRGAEQYRTTLMWCLSRQPPPSGGSGKPDGRRAECRCGCEVREAGWKSVLSGFPRLCYHSVMAFDGYGSWRENTTHHVTTGCKAIMPFPRESGNPS